MTFTTKKEIRENRSKFAVWPLGPLTCVSPCLSPSLSMHTHRSPKPAFPASWRVDPEWLEETLNHLFVTYTPLPIITLLPCVLVVHLNPEAADHKDWKEGTGQSPCFSWVIYLFMEALYSHFKWTGIIIEAQWVTPLWLRAWKTFPALFALRSRPVGGHTGEVS